MELSKSDLPRERLFSKGADALSNSELLAIILGNGSKGIDVFSLSKNLSNIGFEKLSSLSIVELQKINGLGFAKSCKILSIFEICARFNISKHLGKKILDPKSVYSQFSLKLSNLDRERFIVLHLDTKNRIIKEEVVSIGTLNESLVHPREVFKSAIKESAKSILLLHNHPSGDPAPSQEDIDLTKHLVSAGKLLQIKVLDHIIIGRESFYSFTEQQEFVI